MKMAASVEMKSTQKHTDVKKRAAFKPWSK